MKKIFCFCCCLLFLFSLSAGVLADAAVYDWEIQRDCSYDRYVATVDGGVNLRTEPTTQASIICTIPDFVRLRITMESTNGWGYTAYNGSEGWVALNQLSSSYPASDIHREVVVSASDGVNLREGPDVSYAKVRATIPTGTALTVTSLYSKKNWGFVTYDGTSGWIALSEVTDAAAAKTQEAPTVVQEEPAEPAETDEALNGDTDAAADIVIAEEPERDFPLIPFLIGLVILVVAFAAILLIVLLTRKK